MYVNKFAHHRWRQPEFECHYFHGQLLRTLVVEVPAGVSKTKTEETVLLAVIHNVKVKLRDSRLHIVRYDGMGAMTVVDLKMVECVVGRVHDRGKWAIIDRQPFSHPPDEAASVDSIEPICP